MADTLQTPAASDRADRSRLARRSGRLRQWAAGAGALPLALGVSAAVHVAALTIHLVEARQPGRTFRDTPLEVILVNARTQEAPAEAKAIAQAQLAGGGEAAEGRATSPLPLAPTVQLGNAVEDARRRIDNLQDEQQQLLAQVRRELAKLPPPDPRRTGGDPREREQEDKRRHMLKLLAEIEKRVNEQSARPKQRYVGPATQEAAYARYYDRLRLRIEERGTRYFPEMGGQKLYGELTMNITVDAAGEVLLTELILSSGNRALDQRAQAIVRAAAPFGRFDTTMRNQADQLIVTSRFRFTRADALEATVLAAP